MAMGEWLVEAERLHRLAEQLAAPLAARAHRSTTLAQERAVLRLFGIDGLDAAGRPLAASVVEAYCGADPRRLAGGIALPFAVALLEYGLAPRELALEATSGTVDLALEAELLEQPDRRTAAERLARELTSAALVRIEENRTASRDLRDVLGEPARPSLAVALVADDTAAAQREARSAVNAGAGLVRVRVPSSWELAEARRLRQGTSHYMSHGFRARRDQHPEPSATEAAPPAGSQRGLAVVRRTLDEASAERGAYTSLMTITAAFAAPEQAVVAALERVDVVEADPLREIVEDSVDPDRALADHAFARRLHARSGCRILVGPGPLALGVDVARGMPSDAVTRAGRALAMQALGIELALADGLPAESLLVGAVPDWLFAETDGAAIVAQAWLRRLLFPGHALAIATPFADATPGPSSTLVATLVAGGGAAFVMPAATPAGIGEAADELRAAAAAAGSIGPALTDGQIHGRAAALAAGTLRQANDALERFAADGWSVLLGDPVASDSRPWLGGSAIVERASSFDPLAEPVAS